MFQLIHSLHCIKKIATIFNSQSKLSKHYLLFFCFASIMSDVSFAGTPVNGVTDFNNLYSGSFVDLTGTQSAGSTGLPANNVDGYNFKIFSLNNNADCGIGIEPFTGQTAMVYGYTSNGNSYVDSLEISSNGLTYFDLQSVDISIDDNALTSRSVTLKGYHNGNPVAGATLTITLGAASSGTLLTTFNVSSNAAFVGVDKFTITVPGTDVGAIGVDNVNAINFRSSVLPLTLVSFTGKSVTKGIQLEWSTSNQVNTSDFEIDRSTDGITFENIGQVQANNSQATTHTYTFEDDNTAAAPAYFYHLKMTDQDGRFMYSPTIKINFPAYANGYSIYPNPVTTGTLHLKIRRGIVGEIQITIIATDGKTLYKKIMNTANISNNNIDIPVSQLSPGEYRLCITGIKSGLVTSLQFVK